MRANKTQHLLQDNDVKFWGSDIWPGNSPDLNVAECIGSIIKGEVETEMLSETEYNRYHEDTLKMHIENVLTSINIMSQHIKTGHLRYFHKGLLSKKWKDYYFVLFDDSTLQWFEKQNDRKPDGSIRIRDVARNLCVGPYTRCFRNRPQLSRPTDEANLIALPRSLSGDHHEEIVWILCNDVSHLNEWMKAIVSTLPPAPQQPSAPSPHPQQNNAFQPPGPPRYHAPSPYPNSSSYPQQPQPNHNHTTVVVQPSFSYGGGGYSDNHRGGRGGSSLVSAGAGLAGGALLGGALGYAWGGGFNEHNGWGYGMGPGRDYHGYGEWGSGDNDNTVINNYYNNDTTNNDISYYNETNNFNDNDNQGSGNQGYGGYEGYGGDNENFGNQDDNGNQDNDGNNNDHSGGVDDNSGGSNYGEDDYSDGGGDFGVGDFGSGDW
ncbi:unnamed protein product [Rotaria magnacalcarata]